MSLDQKVGTQVTIDGTARNAMAGAVVLLPDRTPVYVQGVDSWDDATDGKKISASGTLRKHGGDDVLASTGEQRSGIASPHFVLEQPTWTLS